MQLGPLSHLGQPEHRPESTPYCQRSLRWEREVRGLARLAALEAIRQVQERTHGRFEDNPVATTRLADGLEKPNRPDSV